MKDKEIDNYTLASDSWGAEEIEAIKNVIRSNRFTMGEKYLIFKTSLQITLDLNMH